MSDLFFFKTKQDLKYLPWPEPIRAFLDFFVKNKFELNLIQYLLFILFFFLFFLYFFFIILLIIFK